MRHDVYSKGQVVCTQGERMGADSPIVFVLGGALCAFHLPSRANAPASSWGAPPRTWPAPEDVAAALTVASRQSTSQVSADITKRPSGGPQVPSGRSDPAQKQLSRPPAAAVLTIPGGDTLEAPLSPTESNLKSGFADIMGTSLNDGARRFQTEESLPVSSPVRQAAASGRRPQG